MELETFLRILIHRWRIIIPIFTITFFTTLIFTLNQPRIYEAKATYVAKLSPTITDNREFASILDILSSRIEIPTTYAEVANSRRIKALAGNKLNLSPEVLSNLSVDSRLIPGTNIIEVAVQGTNPNQVRDFANAIGSDTITYVQALYETFALVPLDEAVTPHSPVGPKTTLNLILGAILGLVLGGGMALLTNFYQTSEKTPKEFPPEVTPESSSIPNVSILNLQEEITVLHEQFRSTRQALNQIQAALQKANSYAKDIRSTVYDLEERFDANHVGAGEVIDEKKKQK
jgi:capsular polysaccharide biosynthesis protein